MKENKITIYTIYEIKNNDITNIKESKNLQEIAKFLDINYKNINQYTIKNLDDINNVKNKIIYNNKYVVFKEKIDIKELEEV